MAAKITHIITRFRAENYYTDEFYASMQKIKNCTHCGHCKENCPYGLDTPSLLASELEKYEELYTAHHNSQG